MFPRDLNPVDGVTQEIGYYLAGNEEVRGQLRNGETYELRAGDRDFLSAKTSHAAFVPGKEPVRYLIGVRK